MWFAGQIAKATASAPWYVSRPSFGLGSSRGDLAVAQACIGPWSRTSTRSEDMVTCRALQPVQLASAFKPSIAGPPEALDPRLPPVFAPAGGGVGSPFASPLTWRRAPSAHAGHRKDCLILKPPSDGSTLWCTMYVAHAGRPIRLRRRLAFHRVSGVLDDSFAVVYDPRGGRCGPSITVASGRIGSVIYVCVMVMGRGRVLCVAVWATIIAQ